MMYSSVGLLKICTCLLFRETLHENTNGTDFCLVGLENSNFGKKKTELSLVVEVFPTRSSESCFLPALESPKGFFELGTLASISTKVNWL